MNHRQYEVIRKPGPGWRHVNGSVWEHDSGMRLHTLGQAGG